MLVIFKAIKEKVFLKNYNKKLMKNDITQIT